MAIPVIRDADDRNGKIAAIAYLVLVFCLLFFIKYQEPDPPKITVPIPIVMEGDGIEDFEIDYGGGGSPSDESNVVPTDNNDSNEQDVQEEESPVKVNPGKGKTETNTPPNPAPDPKPNDPFSGSGTGGQGTDGSGTGLGSDTGPGSGTGDPGKGMAGNRIRLSDVTTNPKTPNAESGKISFKVIVDSRGVVLRADVIRSETTTTNQTLIDEVAELVKKELKYKEKPGSENEVAYYTVRIKPN